ncbi:MAG: FecR domain-containing protein [Anaerolineales bacterium]|nr:FecR domain-containing protein [Anaerolineales bacterium]
MGIASKSSPIPQRERLAWGILIGSFVVCLTLTVAVPVSVSAFIQNAKQLLPATVQANQGSVRVSSSVLRRVVLAGEAELAVEPSTRIQTDDGGTANLFITPPDNSRLLARLQIYTNTSVWLEEASTPRFGVSDAGQAVALDLQNGRLRLTLPEFQQRPLIFSITTPQSLVQINTPGTYSIEANDSETQLTVQSGAAQIQSQEHILDLKPQQRAVVINDAPPSGPLTPEQNLIENGDFSAGLDNWAAFAWNLELKDQPSGETQVSTRDGEEVLSFTRTGVGHADVRIQQSINKDVADFTSVRLLLTFRILQQELSVCGFKGSECPLFVRLNYTDEEGVSRIWQQGFYGFGTVDDSTAPGACLSCAVIQSSHLQTTLGQLYVYDVDIAQELARQGFLPPRTIESVTIVGSGHSFATEVLEAALIAEE